MLFLSIIIFVALYVALVFIEAAWGMVLFNLVMALFGIKFALTFPQAVGLCLLLSFLSHFFRSPSKEDK